MIHFCKEGLGGEYLLVRGAQEITLSSKSYNSSPILYPSLRSGNGREIIRLRPFLDDSSNEITDDCVNTFKGLRETSSG
jgi:hypothetical protein